MRSRLALLVAAAIIFAPAPYERRQSEPPLGADLALRMLAPTFDEGTLGEAVPEVKRQVRGRHVKRFHPAVTLAGGLALMAGLIGLALLWLIASNSVQVIGLIRLSAGFSRAPPALQLA
jgi:hypothetical protein